MTSNKVVLSSMENNIESKVKLRNDNDVSVNGKSVVVVNVRNEEIITVDKFFYVLGMKFNLINVGQVMEKNYIMSFKDKVYTILDKYPSNQLKSTVDT